MFDLFTYAVCKRQTSNAVSQIINNNYATSSEVDSAIENIDFSPYATKEEMNAIKPTYKPFPEEWNTAASETINDFCQTVDTDENATEGMAFLGELRCSDFRSSGIPLDNSEAVVEIIDDRGSNGKVIHINMSSGNVSPYRWEYTYWNNGNNTSGWIEFNGSVVEPAK